MAGQVLWRRNISRYNFWHLEGKKKRPFIELQNYVDN